MHTLIRQQLFACITVCLLAFAPPAVAQNNAQNIVRNNGQDTEKVLAVKYPNSSEEGHSPVHSWAWSTPESDSLPGFTELLPYALNAPDQLSAGTCLYMSLTGILEWWLARLNPISSRANEGSIDLSERWLVNLAGDPQHTAGIYNWRVDTIGVVNSAGAMALNRDYRFTKGWYVYDRQGRIKKSHQADPLAKYDEMYNWLDERDSVQAPLVSLPRFERTILFADPEQNQWNVGVMPSDIVSQVKQALKTHKAPVQVLYNHMGYWHALILLGYDDNRDSQGCEFVEASRKYFAKEPSRRATSEKLERSIARRGSSWCQDKGMFYVRDSIYGSDAEPVYQYDPSKPEATGHYSRRLVLLEYAWLEHLANHAIMITPAP